MRLRLAVERHELPAAKILWQVSEGQTISKLLESINDTVPLESDEWSFEDYTVAVGGFEALHFQKVDQILKEDDCVVIRALQSPDIRARDYSGRRQISARGKHLYDGVPFGRPYLKRTDRPSIYIPPRKRRLVESNDDGTSIYTVNNGTAEADTDTVDLPTESDQSVRSILTTNAPSSFSNKKRVSFDDSSTQGFRHSEDPCKDSDEDSDTDFDPDESGSSDGISESESEDSVLQSSTEPTSEEPDDLDADLSATLVELNNTTPLVAKSISPDTLKETEDTKTKTVAPGTGKRSTQARNRRRTAKKLLQKLQQTGRFDASTKIADVNEAVALNANHDRSLDFGTTRNKFLKQLAYERHDTVSNSQVVPTKTWVGAKRKIDESYTESNESASGPSEHGVTAENIRASSMESNSPKRAKLNFIIPDGKYQSVTTGSKGSKKGLKKDGVVRFDGIGKFLRSFTESKAPPAMNEKDRWKTKIDLAAYACTSTESSLPEPLFPLFENHGWERTKPHKGSEIRPKNITNATLADQHKEVTTGLDYGDDVGSHAGQTINGIISPSEHDSLFDMRAAETQLKREMNQHPEAEHEHKSKFGDEEMQAKEGLDANLATSDLPEIPSNPSKSLPVLQAQDRIPGAIIAFRLFEVSMATGWAPANSPFRTARIEAIDGDQLRLRLAKRDRPSALAEYDDDGNRVWGKFEMPSADEEDESVLVLETNSLVEPRLVSATTPVSYEDSEGEKIQDFDLVNDEDDEEQNFCMEALAGLEKVRKNSKDDS